MTRYYAAKAMQTVEPSARKVIAAVAEGDMLRTQMAILRRLAKHEPADTIAIGPADREARDRGGPVLAVGLRPRRFISGPTWQVGPFVAASALNPAGPVRRRSSASALPASLTGAPAPWRLRRAVS